jgi:uncharacterized membrane protein HdeD (DUF308 family)
MVDMRWFAKSGLYALWSIGVYILLRVFNDIASWLRNYQASTFNVASQWLLPMELVLGMYVGILFVRQWKFKLNAPLLIFVFLPSLYMNTSVDLWILHIKSVFFPESQWVSIHDILGVLSGIVLMVGLFDARKNIYQ